LKKLDRSLDLEKTARPEGEYFTEVKFRPLVVDGRKDTLNTTRVVSNSEEGDINNRSGVNRKRTGENSRKSPICEVDKNSHRDLPRKIETL